ncbi:aminotransferase class I/II-fold pyridoxal phosphate-dependent enzyme [Thiocapsa rosea]|uniref:8-amino-7-oxononanoate synthase n=1 Tax=Thiocapsa rosea TaxID=69360 RepID=A0A495V6G1_9GAMM|nr:aminotransferase class I/II-fold pyridoxal phosphate-dependent enzyme [Thiocapsa rosea]RKT44864.1 8-amino-7-oxononanoate synthase [Thiocapsa rosea]
MPDFTSALYLGMRHAHASLCPWAALTTGRPAALQPPPAEAAVAARLAVLMGCEAAVMAPSTLHLALDLLELVAGGRVALLVEAGTYPILRWGLPQVVASGIPVLALAHHNPGALDAAIAAVAAQGRRPIVVADGLCPATGAPAPLPDYLALVAATDGLLIIDDTQALGILGRSPDAGQPWGRDGGGTAAWHGLRSPALVVIASLAKGLGAPVAVLAGNRALITAFAARSRTRSHCSPPSAAHLAAADHALAENRATGEARRARLLRSIRRLHRRLDGYGIRVRGGLFPVQTPALSANAPAVHAGLAAGGIAAVLHQLEDGHPTALSLLVTADHQPWEIDLAAHALAGLASRTRAGRPAWRTDDERSAALSPRPVSGT